MADWSTYRSSRKVYLVDGKRTPFGKFGGSLKDETPVDLAERSGNALLNNLKLDPKLIDHVVFASVLPTTKDN